MRKKTPNVRRLCYGWYLTVIKQAVQLNALFNIILPPSQVGAFHEIIEFWLIRIEEVGGSSKNDALNPDKLVDYKSK